MSEDDKLKIPENPVAEYQKGIAERAARMREARQASRKPLPRLDQADASFDPRKSANTTLGDMGLAQRQLEERSEERKAGLSEATIAGLTALKAEMEGKKAEPPPPEAPKSEPEPPKPDLDGSLAEEERSERLQVPAAVRDVDDLEYNRIVDSITSDVINNKREKEAVEARLKSENNEISLEEGLANGVFTQSVPITDRMRVHYRSVSPMENRAVRLLLWKWVDKDPRLENLASDLYGMMLIVAATTQIGSNKLPEHMVGRDFYSAEFNEEAFERKFNLLSRYPGPLIHAIGVHANWFDERVRKLFASGTFETLKNG